MNFYQELQLNQAGSKSYIAKLIYRLFLEGMTPHTIAIHLTEKGIKTPGGKDKWNATTIRRILTNEKYKGDALLQKEFTVDFLTTFDSLSRSFGKTQSKVWVSHSEGGAIVKQTDFGVQMTSFFTMYLPTRRDLSDNTISSYRDTFKLLLSLPPCLIVSNEHHGSIWIVQL